MNTHHEMTNGEIVTKGGVGTGASLGAWYLAHVQQINSTLQTGCLVLGLTISAISLWKLLFKKRSRKSSHP